MPTEPCGGSAPATTSQVLRTVAPSVFLPAFVYEIGNGAMAPIIALTALQLGTSVVTAGYLLALLGVGQVIGDLPSSALATRIGDRRAMLVAAVAAAGASVLCLLTQSVVLLGVALLVIGMANAVFYLARQAYLSDVVPTELRARALSTLSGSHRIGLFLGPFVGGLVISATGLRAGYLVAVASQVVVVALLITVSDAPAQSRAQRAVRRGVGPRTIMAENWRLFGTLGVGMLFVGAVRGARQTVVPLWAAHIGLTAGVTSLIFGITNVFDIALFYPAGKAMDEWGRVAVAVPAMALLGIGTMLLPLSRGALSLSGAALVISLGSGIGSGIMMTIAADAAPRIGRLSFLSIWRVMGDTGSAGGPLLVAFLGSVATLAAGIVAVGSAGLIAAGALAIWTPRYSSHATRRMILARREGTVEER